MKNFSDEVKFRRIRDWVCAHGFVSVCVFLSVGMFRHVGTETMNSGHLQISSV